MTYSLYSRLKIRVGEGVIPAAHLYSICYEKIILTAPSSGVGLGAGGHSIGTSVQYLL